MGLRKINNLGYFLFLFLVQIFLLPQKVDLKQKSFDVGGTPTPPEPAGRSLRLHARCACLGIMSVQVNRTRH